MSNLDYPDSLGLDEIVMAVLVCSGYSSNGSVSNSIPTVLVEPHNFVFSSCFLNLFWIILPQREIRELRGKLSRLGGKLQDEVINRQVSFD